MRSPLLSLVLLLPLFSYSQDCQQLLCSEGGLTYTLYPTEDGICLWPIAAVHFLDESLDECSSAMNVAVYRAFEVTEEGPDFEPDFSGARDTLWLTEDDEQTTIVSLFFEAPGGLVQSCDTYLLITEHTSIHCFDPVSMISGVIRTADDEHISNVEVSVSSTQALTTLLTGADGFYSIALPNGDQFSITPRREDNPLNGVSTFDLILISKHILGIQPINNPYKLIAADVNGSGSVTVLDMIKIRQLILNRIIEFPGVPSWRFVSANYPFPVPANPWQEAFPELVNGEAGTAEAIAIDFIGIKIGDVNGSVIAN